MRSPRGRAAAAVAALLAACALGIACSGEVASRHADVVDVSAMPESVRADYQLFAERCSKCHSLARPLAIGPQTDDYWATYVERMRRQAGSGISREDVVVVLRFLHYLSEQERASSRAREGEWTPAASASSAPAAAPASASTPEGRN